MTLPRLLHGEPRDRGWCDTHGWWMPSGVVRCARFGADENDDACARVEAPPYMDARPYRCERCGTAMAEEPMLFGAGLVVCACGGAWGVRDDHRRQACIARPNPARAVLAVDALALLWSEVAR